MGTFQRGSGSFSGGGDQYQAPKPQTYYQQPQQQAYQQPVGSFAYTAGGGAPVNFNPAHAQAGYGHSDFYHRGDQTGGDTARRMLREWEQRGMTQLAPEADVGRPGGPAAGYAANPGYGNSTPGGAAMGGGAGGGDAELARQRGLLEGAIGRQQNFYNQNPLARQLTGNLGQQMAQGMGDAYSNAMFSRAADASSANKQAQLEMIRRRFGGAGMGGGGGQLGAELNVQRQQGDDLAAARREIDIENARSKERAQAQSGQYLGQQAQNLQFGTGLESDFRSRFQVIGDAGLGAGGSALGLLGGSLPFGYQGRATGGVPGQTFQFQSQQPVLGGGAGGGGFAQKTAGAAGATKAPAPAPAPAPQLSANPMLQQLLGAMNLGAVSAPQAGYGPGGGNPAAMLPPQQNPYGTSYQSYNPEQAPPPSYSFWL